MRDWESITVDELVKFDEATGIGSPMRKQVKQKQLSINKKISVFLLAVSARWHLQRYSFEPHFIYLNGSCFIEGY